MRVWDIIENILLLVSRIGELYIAVKNKMWPHNSLLYTKNSPAPSPPEPLFVMSDDDECSMVSGCILSSSRGATWGKVKKEFRLKMKLRYMNRVQ